MPLPPVYDPIRARRRKITPPAVRPLMVLSLLVLPLMVLPLGACATDELAIAPAAPDRPWIMPPSSDDLPRPGFLPTDGIPVNPTRPLPGPDASGSPAAATTFGDAWPDDDAPDTTRRNAVRIDPARRYDLAGLIDLAQRNNPETRAAWEQARQAALAVGLSETSYVPQISAEIIGGFQHTPLPIPTTLIPQGYFTSNTRELIPTLAAKWLLFDFGQRAGAERAARANAFVANVAFTGAHQKLIYAVSRDYFALGAAQGRQDAAQQALKTAGIVQDAAETRRRYGLATVVDVARAHRQTAQARFNLERATAAVHAAYEALIDSMGIAPDTTIRTADSSALRLPAIPSGDVDRFVRDALAGRPDIVAALGKVRAAEATLDSARASFYPTIGLEAQAYENVGGLSTQGSSYYTVNEPGANILLKLSLPLFDGGARDARIAMARAAVSAAHASLDQTRDTAVRQVADTYDALHTSFAEYEAAVTLTAAAHTAYEAALAAYRQGVGTYTDLVSEETAWDEAQSEVASAHANVFTAAAALAFSTGTILSQP